MRSARSALAVIAVAALAAAAQAPAASGASGASDASGAAGEVKLLVQRSPLAGFRHHEAAAAWPAMRVGDLLDLVREPSNAHDANAVRVQWQGRMLGYVPRAQNQALAWAMDRGEPVTARIATLRVAGNGRKLVEFEVYLD
jgi:hypothetical protein